MNRDKADDWFQQLARTTNKDTPHIVIGYGSLLSKQSRDLHSNINSLSLPVTVQNWERSWVTRSLEEKQTYVGAYKKQASAINAQAFYTNIDQQLQKREQDYRFAELKLEQLKFQFNLTDTQIRAFSSRKIYICETLELRLADNEYPVSDSYIDTCLKGCMESGEETEVKRFISMTSDWPHSFKYNDRHQPIYPRAAQVHKSDCALFDHLQFLDAEKIV